MRPATIVAGVLVIAAAGMTAVALAGGGDEEPAPPARAEATPAPTSGKAAGGFAVWARHGCGGCHTFAAANSHGVLGPDLGNNLAGMPASYVKESIVAPDAVIAAGYSGGLMPGDYAQRIPPADLDRLVTYILRGVPG